jgi:hypothetical protein
MYAWIWQHLPGGATWVRALLSLVLVVAVVAVLFLVVFPWLDGVLGINEVTIDSLEAPS